MNMETPKISILLPFLNGGPAFGPALRSILQQTYTNWELLLCDDGSTDGSLELARSIQDPRLVVWSDGKTKGLAARLNECIGRARGTLIARMDADDISYPDRLRVQAEYLAENANVDVVGCGMLICGEEGQALGKRLGPARHEDIVANPAVGFGLAHPTWMGRAEWFRRYLYDAKALRFEDIELLYRACRASRFANVTGVYYGYREMRGGLKKRFKTRLGRIRYLGARSAEMGRGLFLGAAAAEAVKVVLDAGLMALGARYTWLRQRETPLAPVEAREWEEILDAVAAERPRIVVLTTVPQTMAAFFPRQLRMLAEEGMEVHAVSSPGEGLDRLGRECGIATHGVEMERQPNPRRDVVSLWRLIQLMRQLRPQIVHAHTPKAGLLGMAAAKAAGVPVRLYTVHGLPLATRTGMLRKVLEMAERTSAALSTRTYSVSHSVREEMIRLSLCAADKVRTLGEGSCAGIDVDRFQRAEDRTAARRALGIPEAATVAVFIGRLAKDKGIGVLAEAWPEVIGKRPEMRLVLAGEEDGTDPVEPAALARLRGEPSVMWLGSVEAGLVPAIYSAADLCVLPAFREGLSQVALEAGAMGVPMVASRAMGLDAVVDGVTGVLVPPRDAGRLAAAILALAGEEGKRRAMGAAAAEHVRANYSEGYVNRLWLAEYRTLRTAERLGGTLREKTT
jgi:glycosyltransferase involved in cell wall biosynthesis